MKQGPVVFLFNASLSSGCDYVSQTMRLVSKHATVYGIALGDVISIKQLVFNRNVWITKVIDGAVIIRPISILPGLRFRIIRLISYAITCLFLRLFLGVLSFGQQKILWFFEPFHITELFWIFSGYQTIYDCVDYYPAFSPYAKKGHDRLVHLSTFVFANSETIQNTMKIIRPDVVRVPLGFADELFLSVLKKNKINKIFTVGYVGSISARLNFRLLIESARLMPKIGFVFVGPYETDVFGKRDTAYCDFNTLLSFSNVTWVKEIPKRMIPRAISGFDACMIPYDSANVFNTYSYPMKTMEYLYMQKPVVSTQISEIARIGVIRIISTSQEFVQFVHDVQNGTWTRDDKKLERKIALQNTWEKKIQMIMAKVSSSTRCL